LLSFVNQRSAKLNLRLSADKQILTLWFWLVQIRDYNIAEFEDDFGSKKILECNERYYVPSEIVWLLKSLGFIKIDIYGSKPGAFSINDKLTSEDFEMLIIAVK